jgi:KUP system potassium uptake protein
VGIIRVLLYYGFIESPDVIEGLKLACRDPRLHGIDPELITYYFRRVMVIPDHKVPGMAVWRKTLFATSKRRLTTAVCGAAPALAVGYFVQRQGSNSSTRWTG